MAMKSITKLSRLKILLLTSMFKESGTYFRAFHLGRCLCRMGHDVTLVTLSRTKHFIPTYGIEKNVKIVETPNFLHDTFLSGRTRLEPGHGPFDILSRIKIGLSTEYDVVHIFDHFHNVYLPFLYLRKKLKAKFVADWCDVYHLPGGLRETYGTRYDRFYKTIGFWFRAYNRFVEIELRRMADAVTVISRRLNLIALEKGVEPRKVHLIEGGVDLDLVKPLPKQEARDKLGLPRDAKIIEFMGRFQSDLDIVLKSFPIIKKDVPRSLLLVVGQRYHWTRKLASTLGITDSYIEAGRCSDGLLPLYLACADVFTLPLKSNLANEARWANKFGEYLAAGRPIVISDVGDQAEIVRTYQTGLVATQSIDDFACKTRLLLEDEKLSTKMGQNATDIARSRYNWPELARKLESVYYITLESAAREPF